MSDTTTETTIEAGDVVCLRSGGPAMTVEYIDTTPHIRGM